MKVYSCVKFYASTFKDQPEPRWPVDYDFQEEMSQRDSTITAPVSAYHRGSYAVRYGRYRTRQNRCRPICLVQKGFYTLATHLISIMNSGNARR